MHPFKITILLIISMINGISFAQVGVGTTSPHSSSILEIQSTTKGFLPPRLSLIERNSITNPAEGLLIYNTIYDCLQFFNGISWFDLCCSEKVEDNLSIVNYLYRLDPSLTNNFTKMNLDGSNTGTDAGTIPVDGDYVYSANMLNSDGNISATLNYAPGLSEPSTNSTGDGIFIYEQESSTLPYQQQNYLTRIVHYDGGSTSFNGSRIEADIVDLQQEMEMFIVGKFDGSLPNSSASFFASTDNPGDEHSFQIGAGAGSLGLNSSGCGRDYFTFRLRDNGDHLICGEATQSPDGLDRRVSAESDNLHVFNLRSYMEGGNYVIECYLDGVLLAKIDTLTNHPLIEKLKLFTNRTTRSSAISSIGELIISNELLSPTEHEAVNNYLLCKYSEG